MKRLLVLRHARSTAALGDLADHERGLDGRGKRDALRMGRLLGERDFAPEVVLCSTAVRTRATAQRVMSAGAVSAPIKLCSELYPTDAAQTLDLLRLAPASTGCVLVIAHNPGLEDLVEGFAGAAVPLPTAALAHLQLPIDAWRDATLDGSATLADLWCPRDLEDD